MPVIASLADFLAGLVRMLFVYAARVLIGTIVRGIAGNIPLVGRALGDAADAIADGITTLMRDLAGSTPDTTSGMLLTPTLVVGELMSATIAATANLASATSHTALVVIPRRELMVLNTARAWVDTVSTALARDVVILRAYAGALSAADIAYTSAGLIEANAYTTATGARDVALTEATGLADRSYTAAVGASAYAYTSAVQAELTAFIGEVDHSIVAWTTAEIDTVVRYVQVVEGQILTELDHDLAVLEQTITLTRTQIITEVLPQIEQVKTDLQVLRDTCVDELCRDLSKYGKDKAKLGDLWSIAALLAYAAAAVADPQDTARATNDIIGPVVTGVLDAVIAVTGPAGGSSGG